MKDLSNKQLNSPLVLYDKNTICDNSSIWSKTQRTFSKKKLRLKEQYQYERERERRILINLCLINNRNTMPVFIQENHLNRIITIPENTELILERRD